MDARVRERAGLTMKARADYDAFYSSAACCSPSANGLFRPYHDTVFGDSGTMSWRSTSCRYFRLISAIGGSADDFEPMCAARPAPSMTHHR